jgi:hypothetical protein
MSNLPPLKGSSKQIVWAESIRQKFLDSIPSVRESLDKLLGRGSINAEKKAVAENAILRLQEIEESKWWIEHRGDTPINVNYLLNFDFHFNLSAVSGLRSTPLPQPTSKTFPCWG